MPQSKLDWMIRSTIRKNQRRYAKTLRQKFEHVALVNTIHEDQISLTGTVTIDDDSISSRPTSTYTTPILPTCDGQILPPPTMNLVYSPVPLTVDPVIAVCHPTTNP